MYQLNVWIHLVMATVWVGGLIYTAAIVIPFAITKQGDERQQIIRGLARRFRRIGWTSIFVLVITGLLNLYLRPWGGDYYVTGPDDIPRFPKTMYIGLQRDPSFFHWLIIKLIVVVLMIALMLFHDITSMNAAKRHEGQPGSPPTNRLGSMAAALATLLAVIVLYLSVRLVRG